MKAACGPQSNSHRRHGYTTNRATSLSKSNSVNTSSQSCPKMVMPPFLRLDSTGEVSDDRPDQAGVHAFQGQQQKTTTGGFLPKMMFGLPQHQASFAAHHLTAPQIPAQGGISALDDLISSNQTLNCVTKRAMRSPVKMAHQTHSSYQRSNRYGQWGGVIGQHYPYFPPGVFPCHMFMPLCIPSTSGQGVYKAAWVTGVNLMNTCEQFVAQPCHPVPSVQPLETRVLCNRSASSSPQRDSKTFLAQSPGVSEQHATGAPALHEEKQGSSNTESIMKPPICLSSEIQPCVEDRPKPSFAENKKSISSCSMSSCVSEHCMHSNNSVDSTIFTCAAVDSPVPVCVEKPTATLDEPIPSSSQDRRENDTVSSAAVNLAKPVSLCKASSDTSMSKGAENQSVNKDSFYCNTFSQFSDLVGDDLEVDWDDDTDECDAVDEASEAEAWNSFQCSLLHENNLLGKLKKEEIEEEQDRAQQVRTPPKPDHAANQRWNLHHPALVPSDRKSKVQFSCGKEVDEVHLFERDTLTMMEIQKLRDISRANEGRAGHILRKKKLESISDEDDTSGNECAGSPQKSDLAHHSIADSCNSVSHKGCDKAEKDVRGEECLDGRNTHADVDSDDEDDDLEFSVYGCIVSAESESEREDDDEWVEEEEDEEDDGFVIAFE